GLALAREPDAVAVRDAGGDLNVDGADAVGDAAAAAVGARVVDLGSRPAAVGAGLGEAEGALRALGHAGAVAGAAHLGAGPRLGAPAVAGQAGRGRGEFVLDGLTERGLAERQGQ